ncbi:Thioesterase/thiol ester dehydrase-isomerase [Suhomyces tanzawaensis NRRL Y-17324]|uniref:Thioesterase/thiol ester dehydrase-isomerase n=1 Tax=Suhomyces tanzawaensis NRRL Y-17324 TaxID=984487 RepID=A0A1E4SAU1_9ASCO|nr:Thioesterase/thiol ester dehydrase-isomerase [Suhomyces tanzawaensis NRRL Y-17324]ODV76623.1 Thioesterase/thiol ester dehydrase-isomerase [Suhomyces tanzawaensis NRRL Y-17324]
MAQLHKLGLHSPSKLSKSFAVKKVGENKYQGVVPLSKPSATSRGVFGGNLCAQAVVAAMEHTPGFVPHSLHSYFVKAGDDQSPCEFEVETVSDGNNFANRLVRVVQKLELKYMVMISLTKKNSMASARHNFKAGKSPHPVEYQVPASSSFYKYNHRDLPVHTTYDHGGMLQHKFPPDFLDHSLSHGEHEKSPGERDFSFWIRIGDEGSKGVGESKFKYAGFGMISDSLFLTSLARTLRLPLVDGSNDAASMGPTAIKSSGGKGPYFFSVSLDHSVFFHDDDFDPHEWIYASFKAPRLCNNRVLFQGSYFDTKGRLFASIVQEGLVFFDEGNARKAKL